MSEKDPKEFGFGLSRRTFLMGAAAAGLGMMLEHSVLGQAAAGAKSAPGTLNIAMIGVGREGGESLLPCCLKIPGVRFVAICDIWPRNRNRFQKLLASHGQPVSAYEDYREMLAKEKAIDAVIIATPDFMHSEHTVACLKAGKHVYCEKEMSNTVEGARAMVVAARETGKLLQIGHQRRSNPRYHLAIKMIDHDKILGRPICFHGQWDRAIASSQDMVCAPKDAMTEAQLKKWGYDSMQSFLNWRWYRRYGGGPIVDLGSHQIDVFSWFLKAPPKAVMASGGKDYFKDREWYDNVMATFEYDTPSGSARGTYQVLTTTSYGGWYELFNGTDGSLIISEADTPKTQYFPEFSAKQPSWVAMSSNVSQVNGAQAVDLKIGESLDAKGRKAVQGQAIGEAATTKKPWQFHLENFFAAIKDPKVKLNCPAELAFESCVSVHKVNEAIAAGKRLEFDPKEFKA